MGDDLLYILKWWIILLGIGLVFFPLTHRVFKGFFDKGYIFAKTVGIAVMSYLMFILGTLRILPFHEFSIYLVGIAIIILSAVAYRRSKFGLTKINVLIIVFQEILFLASLLFWSYIKSFQPDIHGLEKFMDYGFMNAILRSSYFPPVDIWFPPEPINYYYFGHLVTAFLIKLTSIPNFIAYNLMLATIFAFTVTSSFSIVSTLTDTILKIKRASFLSGILAGIVTSLGGNLHTIYAFFAPYIPAENPVPFWQLRFLPDGLAGFPNGYWYPNATRFIPFTIHEFPSYSFVVSDLHGHVLDIPFVFLTLALFLSLFLAKSISLKMTVFISFMLAVMYMTNAWDGIIYFGFFALIVLFLHGNILKIKNAKRAGWSKLVPIITHKFAYIKTVTKFVIVAGFGYLLFALPFNLNFKPFVSGIGVICPPEFLIKIGNIGPLIFEADHCQRTPFWMLTILYGFFYFFAIAFVIKILKLKKTPLVIIYVLLLILLSTLLIATPEFIYAKDIYPAHYRANTMFKLGYQAFIMLSLVASFSITFLLHKGKRIIWIPVSLVLLSLILMYPYFAVNSYFGNLTSPKGLDGISYLKTLHPDDYLAIQWIQSNIENQPIMVEAQGDSYTDYGRISANTGLATPLGWTVHEWLWRGDYSFPQSRIEDMRLFYEGTDDQMRSLIKKYDATYIYVGNLERTKYPNLNEETIKQVGTPVYNTSTVRIYKVK